MGIFHLVTKYLISVWIIVPENKQMQRQSKIAVTMTGMMSSHHLSHFLGK